MGSEMCIRDRLLSAGFVLIAVANLKWPHDNPRLITPGLIVRSLGFVLMLCGCVTFILVPPFKRMLERRAKDESKRPWSVDDKYRLRIVVCYIAMVLCIVKVLYSVGSLGVTIIAFGRFPPQAILWSLMDFASTVGVAIVFWILAWIMSRMRVIEAELSSRFPYGKL